MAIGHYIKMADDRKRIWAFIVYPEEPSIKSDWLAYLRSKHVDLIISPLHSPDPEPDMFEDEGVKKKVHHHCMLLFDGKHSFQQVYDMVAPIVAVTRPFEVYSTAGYIRYMIHLDSPDKEQFCSDLNQAWAAYTCFGQASDRVKQALTLGDFDAYEIQMDIMKCIREHHITEFTHLVSLADGKDNWIYVLMKYPCKPIYSLINSYRYQEAKREKALEYQSKENS